MDRVKARVPEWHAAMARGFAAAPKCGAMTRAKTPCQCPRLRGTDRCHLHLHGKARDVADAARLASAQHRARSGNTIRRAEAEATIAAIARRQLHRAWKLDPTLPGSTLVLPYTDEGRARRWLLDTHGIDLDLEPHPFHANTDYPITPRAVDRLRWAAALHLAGRMDMARAARRVFVAVRDDLRYWANYHGMGSS